MAQAIVAAVAWAGGWGTVATVAISVASAAYSFVAAKKAQSAIGDPSERKQILRSSSASLNYIYGKVRSSGVLIFAQEEAGDQIDGEWVHLVVSHAGHEIDSTSEYRFNDESINEFTDYYKLQSYEAGRTTVDPYLTEHCTDWTATMIGEGFSWFRVSLKFNQDKFPTGLPNINCIKKGYKVPDPRNNKTQWSDNPALCILHFLKTRLGWEDEYLLLDTFADSANICDEIVVIPGGGSEKRYTMGCEFEDSDTPASILERMLATCGGEWVRVGGRIGLRVAAYYGPAIIDITESDLIDDVEIHPEVESQDAFNIVRGTYSDPDQDFSEVDFPEVRVDEWVAEDGEEVVMDFDLNYCQSPYQAQRLADIALKRSRLGMTMRLKCNFRGFSAVPGTMINLSLEHLGFTPGEYMVVDWDFSMSESGGVTLMVRRELPSFYDDAVGEPVTTPPLISLPTGGIAAPTSPLFTAKPVGDVVQGVISWQNSSYKLASTTVIVKDNAGFVVQTASVPWPGSEMELNGKLAGAYDVSLTAIGVNGAKSTETKMSVVISAPVVPDVISVKASNWSVHLIPGYKAGSTPFGTLFEFYSSTTEMDTPPDREPDEVASSWNQGGLTPDTLYHYLIRAVNSYGKSEWVKKSVRTTRETGLVETLVERLVAVEIVSSNYVEGKTGYKIFGPQDHDKDGNAEFNNIIARGDLYAKSLTFLAGATIPPEIDNSNIDTSNIIQDGKDNGELYPNQSNIQIKSSNYIAGQKGWAIDASGNAELNNGIFRGTIQAATGIFNGTIYAQNIVGDVSAGIIKTIGSNVVLNGINQVKRVVTATIFNGRSKGRMVIFPEISVRSQGSGSDGYGEGELIYVAGGKTIYSQRVLGHGAAGVSSIMPSVAMLIPAGWTGDVYCDVKCTDGRSPTITASPITHSRQVLIQLISQSGDMR